MTTTFITRDYCIVDGALIDIVVPAQFVGLHVRDDYIFLRAISDTSNPNLVRRFEFLVLARDEPTTQAIAYDGDWRALGLAGNYTVFVRDIFS